MSLATRCICGSGTYCTDGLPGRPCILVRQQQNEKAYQKATNWLLFEMYIKLELSQGKREFRIAFQDDNSFYIHPLGKDGSTIDLKIENEVINFSEPVKRSFEKQNPTEDK